jgi:hypothetical protein
MRSKRLVGVIAIGLLALVLVLPLSVGQAQGPAAPSASTTIRFRFVNAANTSTGLDLAVDGTNSTVIIGILPLKASLYDTITTTGNHTITLFQTTTTTAVGTPLTFSFAAKTDYTLVLMPDLTWAEYVDTNPPPATGTSNARVINASPNNNPVSPAVDGVIPTEFTGVAYKSASASYLNLPIGTHTITIPGTSALARSNTYMDGHVYTIFIYWNSAKNLPLIVLENDTNILAGTPTATMTPTATNTPTATSTPTATAIPTSTSTPIPSPTQVIVATSIPSVEHIYLPVVER